MDRATPRCTTWRLWYTMSSQRSRRRERRRSPIQNQWTHRTTLMVPRRNIPTSFSSSTRRFRVTTLHDRIEELIEEIDTIEQSEKTRLNFMTVLAYYSFFLSQAQKDEEPIEWYSVLHNSYFKYNSTTAVNLNFGTDPITRYCKCLNTKDTEPNVIMNNLVQRRDKKFDKQDQAGSERLSFSQVHFTIQSRGVFFLSCFLWTVLTWRVIFFKNSRIHALPCYVRVTTCRITGIDRATCAMYRTSQINRFFFAEVTTSPFASVGQG